MRKNTIIASLAMALASQALAQNPIISGQFTADPTARVFNGKIYLYPSHDIPSPIEKLKTWFCMPDYHVFSSSNLTDWHDHGIIVSQDRVPWVQDGSYAMWAPDCVCKDGKYYFYFPAAPKGVEKGFGVGVAVADSPEGPFMPMWKPIEGVNGIDPCVLIDRDGQAYIYWAGMGLHMAKLKPNMMELASEPQLVEGLPEGFKEGPFAFERQDKEWQQQYANTVQDFLYSKGIDDFIDQYNVDGSMVTDTLQAGDYKKGLRHSIGLVATSAAASLVSTHLKGKAFVDRLWNARHEPYKDGFFDAYYDGLLRLFAFMHLSGNYRIIEPRQE